MAPHSIEKYIVDELVSDRSHSDIIRNYLEKLDRKDLIGLFDNFLEKEQKPGMINIPLSIISNRELSSLELVVKFLREESRLSNAMVASLLKRSQQVCWNTYHNSRKKYPHKLIFKSSRLDIPVSIFGRRGLSILEAIVVYLKENKGLSFHEIAVLLNRDDRTIWTVFNRARKKKW